MLEAKSGENDISKNPPANQRKLSPLALVRLNPINNSQNKVHDPAAHAHQPNENEWPEEGKGEGILVGGRKTRMRKNAEDKNHHGDHHQDEIDDVPGQRLQSMKRNEFRVAFDEKEDERRKEARENSQHMRKQRHCAFVVRRNVESCIGLVGAQISPPKHLCGAQG